MALRDITLGQYFPGNSFIHRLDPRSKVIAVILYIIALFCCKWYVSYALVFLFLLVCILISRVGFRALLRGLKPVLIILILTGFLNIFYSQGEHLLVHYGIITIYAEGIRTACFMIARIMMLIIGTFLLTYTTSPIQLSDALESLLSPLKKLHAPIHELAMMMSIALRFIPLLIEETDKIISAQKARGAEFNSGNLMQKAKALIPVLIPLFVSSFRRADDLATAMECRCYHGGEGRTRLNVLKYGRADIISIAFCCIFTVTIIILGKIGL